MTTNRILLAAGLIGMSFGLTACPTDPMPDTPGGTDTPRTDTPGEDTPMMMLDTPGGITNDCAGYCAQTTANCTGDNAQYDDMAECMTYCTAAAWPAGTPGAMDGNTIACRIYHGGVAAGMPAVHCPHAGPSGAGVCGAAITFNTAPAAMFTRVDRMGMPAVSTALVPSARKDAYNDAFPMDDAALTFAGDILPVLTGIHTALDDDLTGLGLSPCSMATTRTLPIGPMGAGVPVPLCAAQAVATGGPPVVALVVPDTLSINPANMAGFPNGRRLEDRVIDVTLAIILLDLEGPTGCGGSGCRADTLAGMPLNPGANDRAFLTEFPYLAARH